jgi:hypothetical protein
MRPRQCSAAGALTNIVTSSPGSTHAPTRRARDPGLCVRAQAQAAIAVIVNASTMANEKLLAKPIARHAEHAAQAFATGHRRASE